MRSVIASIAFMMAVGISPAHALIQKLCSDDYSQCQVQGGYDPATRSATLRGLAGPQVAGQMPGMAGAQMQGMPGQAPRPVPKMGLMSGGLMSWSDAYYAARAMAPNLKGKELGALALRIMKANNNALVQVVFTNT